MAGVKFQITDAHKAMDNLSSDQALKWTQWANKHYARLIASDGREQYCRKRAVDLANKEVLKRYGINKS
jgi:hypothetical protein